MGCETSDSWFDFCGDRAHGADTGIFATVGYGSCENFTSNSVNNDYSA